MTSKTFPLSRQRRRRTAPKPLVPVQEHGRLAAPARDSPVDEVERAPLPVRDAGGEPLDPATHGAGARPSTPRLPHEHDENTDPPHAPRERIIQAETDLREGQQDTDLRGTAREKFDNANPSRGGR